MFMKNFKKPSDILNYCLEDVGHDGISVHQIKQKIGHLSFYFFIFLFSIPTTLPIPIPPGFHSIFSLPILLFSLQMVIMKKKLYIPQFIEKRKISKSFAAKILSANSKYVVSVEKYFSNRFNFLTSSRIDVVNGAIFSLCAIAIIIPLPFTNWLPSIAISIISSGHLCRDGLVSVFGYFVALIGLAIASVSIFLFLFAVKFAVDAVI